MNHPPSHGTLAIRHVYADISQILRCINDCRVKHKVPYQPDSKPASPNRRMWLVLASPANTADDKLSLSPLENYHHRPPRHAQPSSPGINNSRVNSCSGARDHPQRARVRVYASFDLAPPLLKGARVEAFCAVSHTHHPTALHRQRQHGTTAWTSKTGSGPCSSRKS